jgi:hypothetical protein
LASIKVTVAPKPIDASINRMTPFMGRRS